MCHNVKKGYKPKGNIRYKIVQKDSAYGHVSAYHMFSTMRLGKNASQHNVYPYKNGWNEAFFESVRKKAVLGQHGFHVFRSQKVAEEVKRKYLSRFWGKNIIVKVEVDEFLAGGIIPRKTDGEGKFCETWRRMKILEEVN